MNVLISAILGLGLASAATIGGVSAYQGDPQPVSQNDLYSTPTSNPVRGARPPRFRCVI